MPSLREIQQRFAGDIAAGSTIAPTFVRTSGTSTGERMAVYCRTIRANYRNAMSATYPAVRRIVGTLSFNAAVDAYVDAHPSRCGDLNEYGDAFGDFLHGYAEADELPYLRDVARLEWAIDEAHRAAEPALAPEAVLTALSHVAAGALPELHLGLEPSCRLVASAFPLLRIWQVNQAGYDGDLRVDFTAGPHLLRIRRDRNAGSSEGADGARIMIERIDAGHHEWLCAIAQGLTLAQSLERAVDTDPVFDLQAALQKFIGDGSIDRIGHDPRASPRSGADSVTGLEALRD